jgi:DNA invertase Pin-like site-specific DNA recombinase
MGPRRVQSPCPKSTSHNRPCPRDLRRSLHGTPAWLRRVSTTDQQAQLQVDALQRVGCYRAFTETASGARSDRPAHGQLLDQLRPGYTLVVWRLERLGRSLRHLIDTVTSLADRGIGFRSLQEATETATPGGKFVFLSLQRPS